MDQWTKTIACRICNDRTDLIADLGDVPLTCVFPLPDQTVPYIPVTVRRCPSCGLVQLGESTDPKLMYTKAYGYRSGINESMVSHLKDIVDYAAQFVKPGDLVLDIGYNDGTLLSHWEKYGVNRAGVDPIGWPTRNGAVLKREFFKYHGVHYKVITSIAMLYDLDDPVRFATDVRRSLDDDGVWILEVGYSGSIIKGGLWDGICHEHKCYYGLSQIAEIAKRAGLIITAYSFNKTNGGSLQCTLAKQGTEANHHLLAHEESHWDWTDLADMIRLAAKNVRKAIGERRCYVLGASTKGNMLLSQAWLNHKVIECAIERNEAKVGRVTPGTNIIIRPEAYLYENPPQVLLCLPYHFKDGLLSRYADLREKGVKFLFPLPDIEEV